MNFNEHSEIQGKHAFLSASQYHWINYTDEKLADRYLNWRAAARGSELHELAHNLIRLKVNLPRTNKTLNLYVNDGIGFKMTTEQPLFYSYNAFGTVDAIAFKRGLLRIHDLKTGKSRTSMKQLMAYAALFCLEYKVKPGEIGFELRIYQNDEVVRYKPETDEIAHIMDRFITFDRIIDNMNSGLSFNRLVDEAYIEDEEDD